MAQYKYVSLDAVLNFIPKTIRDEESGPVLKGYAMQGYRANVPDSVTYRYEAFVAMPDSTGKIQLPGHTHKVAFVGQAIHDYQFPGQFEITRFYNHADEEDYRVIIQQELLVNTVFWKGFLPLKYMGQNPSLLTKECCYLTSKCDIGYSVSEDMCFIQIDRSGWDDCYCVVYKTFRKKDKDILVPDDANLLRAMALYAEAMYWQDRAVRAEPVAERQYPLRIHESGVYFRKAKGARLLGSLNTRRLHDIIYQQQKVQKLSIVSGNNRNRRY